MILIVINLTNMKNWSKQFDEKFDDLHSDFYFDCEGHLAEGNIDQEEIKSFITQLLSEQEQEIKEKIRNYLTKLCWTEKDIKYLLDTINN